MSEFKTFEYATITYSRKDAALYTDCYRNFGWEPVGGHEFVMSNPEKASMKIKRDRKTKNRAEITALQRKCENALAAITALERKKTSTAIIAAFTIGLIGTVFMALSVFNIAFFAVNISLVIIFGVLGLICWGLGYLAYIQVGKSQTAKVVPLIEEQYDIVYNTCEQAGTLLA